MRAAKLLVLLIVIFKADAWKKYYSNWTPGSADQYSAISDIDWAKRARDNWISPAYGYASMADSDWGWRKRGDVKRADDDEEEADDSNIRNWSNYFYHYRPPMALASRPSRRVGPHRSAGGGMGGMGGMRATPLKDRTFNYRSMADIDWGRRRKRTEGEDDDEDDSVMADDSALDESALDESVQKRHLSSLMSSGRGFKGDDGKRHLGSLKSAGKGFNSMASSAEKRHLGSLMSAGRGFAGGRLRDI